MNGGQNTNPEKTIPQNINPEKRERMFQAEMLNQQLERLQDYLQRVNKQMGEVLALKDAVDQFSNIQEGEEILAPLAAGVFMKANSTGDKTLHVNVGQGVVVPKSAAEVHKMLDEQLSEMRKYEAELQQQFDAGVAEIQKIEKEFEGA